MKILVFSTLNDNDQIFQELEEVFNSKHHISRINFRYEPGFDSYDDMEKKIQGHNIALFLINKEFAKLNIGKKCLCFCEKIGMKTFYMQLEELDEASSNGFNLYLADKTVFKNDANSRDIILKQLINENDEKIEETPPRQTISASLKKIHKQDELKKFEKLFCQFKYLDHESPLPFDLIQKITNAGRDETMRYIKALEDESLCLINSDNSISIQNDMFNEMISYANDSVLNTEELINNFNDLLPEWKQNDDNFSCAETDLVFKHAVKLMNHEDILNQEVSHSTIQLLVKILLYQYYKSKTEVESLFPTSFSQLLFEKVLLTNEKNCVKAFYNIASVLGNIGNHQYSSSFSEKAKTMLKTFPDESIDINVNYLLYNIANAKFNYGFDSVALEILNEISDCDEKNNNCFTALYNYLKALVLVTRDNYDDAKNHINISLKLVSSREVSNELSKTMGVLNIKNLFQVLSEKSKKRQEPTDDNLQYLVYLFKDDFSSRDEKSENLDSQSDSEIMRLSKEFPIIMHKKDYDYDQANSLYPECYKMLANYVFEETNNAGFFQLLEKCMTFAYYNLNRDKIKLKEEFEFFTRKKNFDKAIDSVDAVTAVSFKNIGLFFGYIDFLELGLNFLLKSLEMLKKLVNESSLPNLYIEIGRFYRNLNDIETAKNFFDKAVSVYENNEQFFQLSGLYIQIGLCHADCQNWTRFYEYIIKSYIIRRRENLKKKDKIYTANSLYFLSIASNEQNRYEDALKYGLEAYEMRQKLFPDIVGDPIQLSILQLIRGYYAKSSNLAKLLEFKTIPTKILDGSDFINEAYIFGTPVIFRNSQRRYDCCIY